MSYMMMIFFLRFPKQNGFTTLILKSSDCAVLKFCRTHANSSATDYNQSSWSMFIYYLSRALPSHVPIGPLRGERDTDGGYNPLLSVLDAKQALPSSGLGTARHPAKPRIMHRSSNGSAEPVHTVCVVCKSPSVLIRHYSIHLFFFFLFSFCILGYYGLYDINIERPMLLEVSACQKYVYVF